jgi:hypothetical protein
MEEVSEEDVWGVFIEFWEEFGVEGDGEEIGCDGAVVVFDEFIEMLSGYESVS